MRKDGRLEVVVVPHELDLEEEIAWINARFKARDAGYCVEVHKNSGGGTGNEAWYLAGSEDGRVKAERVLRELCRVTRLKNRGVKRDVDNRWKRLGWVRDTTPWAGLFECGFIDRDHANHDLYAEGLYRGFLALFGLKDEVAELYRVVGFDGKKLGVFRARRNAWNAYVAAEGDCMILNREGRDVTAEFVAEFVWDAPQGHESMIEEEEAIGPIHHDAVQVELPAPEFIVEEEEAEMEQPVAGATS
jgi:hypothetical protein